MSNLEDKPGRLSKMLSDPIPLIGMGGFFGVVGYSLYNWKKKGTAMKPSVYVIQTRMAAQGLVIALLTVGVGYTFFNNVKHRYIDHDEKPHTNAHQHK